jgi:hypothetical protein
VVSYKKLKLLFCNLSFIIVHIESRGASTGLSGLPLMHPYTTCMTHTHAHTNACAYPNYKKLVVCQYEKGQISLWLYKENKLWNWKNVFTVHIPPELHTHLWLCCSIFFNTFKKNSFGCAANRKTGKAKDLSALLCIHLSFHIVKSEVTTVHCQHKIISVRNK